RQLSSQIFGLAGFFAVLSSARIISAAETVINSSGIPCIQFETNFFDFGSITTGEKLAGVFKFKNVGTGVLKVEPPQSSCDCTEPIAKPDTLAPGESGEMAYTIKLDRALNGQRLINVHSN